MPLARLTLTIPEFVWIGDLTRRFPDATVRVLAAIPDGATGVGLAEVSADDTEAVLSAMEGYDDLPSVEVLQRGDETALAQFETTEPLLLQPVRDSGVPLEMPFEIEDGEAVWEVTAPRDRLSALGDQLDELGIRYSVDAVRDRLADDRLLTDRQRRLLSAAIEAGYYDTPRRCSLTELADREGIAKSTASETLHRAEERIVKQYAAGLDAVESPAQGGSQSQSPKTGTNRNAR